MKLYAYVLKGTPLIDLPHWTINQLEGNAPFIASPTLPLGDYVYVSSIENWKRFGRRANKDYKFVRNEIKLLVNTIGWDNLTESEQKISARLFVIDETKRSTLFTIKRQIKLGFIFHGYSIKTRDQRWSLAEMELMNRLTKSDWRIVAADLNANNLVKQYIDNGLEGTVEGDAAALFDYIDTRSGTPYNTSGLRNKGFVPIGLNNMNALADRILAIIKDGDY